MNWIIFIILLSFTLCLLFLGFYIKDKPMQMAGLFFLFLVSMSFMISGLDYENGYITTHNQTGANLTIESQTITFSNYSNHTFAFFMTALSAFGFIATFFDLRSWFQ